MPAVAHSHRIWGTRYDSLVDAPPVARTVTPPDKDKAHSLNNTPNIVHSPNHDNSTSNISGFQNAPSATHSIAPFPLHEDAVKERIHVQPGPHWHSQQQPATDTSPSTARTPHSHPISSPPSVAHNRMPHDASVFVASLPSHLSDPELQSLLTAHLGRHATVKHVKLIRDNRSAVCAFVQVQSAAQATNLIEKCNFSLFMDRQIRCEKARAFRTLLVSWKKQENMASSDTSPSPLRLRRCRGSRFVQVTSEADALSDPSQLPDFSIPRADDPLSGGGVLFESGLVRNHFESLKELVEAFGPVEFITPFDPKIHQSKAEIDFDSTVNSVSINVETNGSIVQSRVEPATSPENPKLTDEYEGIWAVKWEHRNDAVSAITALQSISDLCVHWCHTYGRIPSHTNNSYSSNSFTPQYSTHRTLVVESATDQDGHEYRDKQCHYYNHTYPYHYNQNSVHGKIDDVHTQAVAVEQQSVSLPLSFSESDFPPLNGTSKADSGVQNAPAGSSVCVVATIVDYGDESTPRKKEAKDRGAWNGRKTFSRSNAPSPSPSSPSYLLSRPLPLSSEEMQTCIVTGNPTQTLSDELDFYKEGIIPRTPDTPDLEPEMEGGEGSASGVDMSPLTPGFADALHTPRSTYIPPDTLGSQKLKLQEEGLGNGQLHVIDSSPDPQDLNQAPSLIHDHARAHSTTPKLNSPPRKKYHQRHRDAHNSHEQRQDNEEYIAVLPNNVSGTATTVPVYERELFVGGLRVESWSEERVRKVFEQYGSIEDLKLVKPGYNAPIYRRAFAFVRYVDSVSAQKAIHGQNMRLYDDYIIKVQLRDCHPNSRRSQWNNRHRSRFSQHSPHELDQIQGVEHGSPLFSPSKLDVLSNSDQPLDREEPAENFVPKYPCITDPLSEEDEAALLYDIDHEVNRNCEALDRIPPDSRSSDMVSSVSPLTSPFKSPLHDPPRANFVRRSTQSEPDLQSSHSLHPNDTLSTYAPSSTESAPASSSYPPQAYFMPNSWVAPYPPCPPVSQEYSQTGPVVPPPTQAVAQDGAFPWMGIYRNVMPAPQWFNPPPGVELTSAPLRPTGYIQRDGIFIPVYPPERLGQYMSTTSTGPSESTDNAGEQQIRSTRSETQSGTSASPTASKAPAVSPPRTSPTQTAGSGVASWNGAHPHLHPPPMYPMHYIMPPPMMFPPNAAANPYSQGQWVPNLGQPVIYPSMHTHAYGNNHQMQQSVPAGPHQQQQSQTQTVSSTPSMAVSGYPPYYYQPASASYPQPGGYPIYYADNTNNSRHGQKPVLGTSAPVGQVGVTPTQAQQQQQTSPVQKYASGNRRDFGQNNSKHNSGRLGRKGNTINGSNGGGGGSPTSNGITPGQSQAKYFSGHPKININALPIQVTASQ